MAEFEQYEMSEADIDKVIAYLKSIDPNHATPKDAIAFLEYYQTMFHGLGHALTDKEMQELYKQFSDKRNFKN